MLSDFDRLFQKVMKYSYWDDTQECMVIPLTPPKEYHGEVEFDLESAFNKHMNLQIAKMMTNKGTVYNQFKDTFGEQ